VLPPFWNKTTLTPMKKTLLLLLCLLACGTLLHAQSLTADKSRETAVRACQRYSLPSALVQEPISLSSGGVVLARVYALQPEGFVIISADQRLTPVYAWSPTGTISESDPHWLSIFEYVKHDLSQRLSAWDLLSAKDQSVISASWEHLAVKAKDSLQVWPAAGTTTTGGWVETNWTQSAPYNNMCPMDLGTSSRSIAGCPSVAMGQILNFLEDLHGTRFNDGDDYFHNYGSSNQYTIDDDYLTWDFPSFDDLNKYLDTLENIYTNKAPLSNNMKAALTFACGVACTQVYSSAGSGTYGVDQAAAAYQRFGYTQSRLVYPADTNLNHDLAENIKAGYPGHVAVVDPGVTVGHNVVADGYNSDEFYHFNFGWGGTSNGWYTMPPSSMPYNLTVIEGVVLDIIPDSISSGITKPATEAGFSTSPNPCTDVLIVNAANNGQLYTIIINDLSGRTVLKTGPLSLDHYPVNTQDWKPGSYLIRIIDAEGRMKVLKTEKI
jgi:hypothetical protein